MIQVFSRYYGGAKTRIPTAMGMENIRKDLGEVNFELNNEEYLEI